MRGLQEPLRGLLEGPVQLENFLSLCCGTSTGCVFMELSRAPAPQALPGRAHRPPVDKHLDSEMKQFQQSDVARPSWGWRGHL